MSGRRPSESGRNNGSSSKRNEVVARMDRSPRETSQASSSSRNPGTRLPLLDGRSPPQISSSSRNPDTQLPLLDGPSLPRLPATLPPSSTRSFLTTPQDKKMASRQPKIDLLSGLEQQEQERWAQRQLRLGAGACPSDCAWRRIKDGYQCTGMGNHIVTDKLLAKGQGVCYQRVVCAGKEIWLGPMSKPEIDEMLSHGRIPVRIARQLPDWIVLRDLRRRGYDGYEIDDRRLAIRSAFGPLGLEFFGSNNNPY